MFLLLVACVVMHRIIWILRKYAVCDISIYYRKPIKLCIWELQQTLWNGKWCDVIRNSNAVLPYQMLFISRPPLKCLRFTKLSNIVGFFAYSKPHGCCIDSLRMYPIAVQLFSFLRVDEYEVFFTYIKRIHRNFGFKFVTCVRIASWPILTCVV